MKILLSIANNNPQLPSSRYVSSMKYVKNSQRKIPLALTQRKERVRETMLASMDKLTNRLQF